MSRGTSRRRSDTGTGASPRAYGAPRARTHSRTPAPRRRQRRGWSHPYAAVLDDGVAVRRARVVDEPRFVAVDSRVDDDLVPVVVVDGEQVGMVPLSRHVGITRASAYGRAGCEFGADVQLRSFEEELLQVDSGESQRRGHRHARAGRHGDGPRRPRQDEPARRDSRDARRRTRSGRHHPAHRRVSRHDQQAEHRVPRYARATRRSH